MHGGRQATAAAAPKTGGSRRKTVDEENEVHPLAGRGTWMELPDHLLAKPEPQVGRRARVSERSRSLFSSCSSRTETPLSANHFAWQDDFCAMHGAYPLRGRPFGVAFVWSKFSNVLSIVTIHCKIARALTFENFK